jgi:hypothetical protein
MEKQRQLCSKTIQKQGTATATKQQSPPTQSHEPSTEAATETAEKRQHATPKNAGPKHHRKQSNGLQFHSYRRYGDLATLPMNHFQA